MLNRKLGLKLKRRARGRRGRKEKKEAGEDPQRIEERIQNQWNSMFMDSFHGFNHCITFWVGGR